MQTVSRASVSYAFIMSVARLSYSCHTDAGTWCVLSMSCTCNPTNQASPGALAYVMGVCSDNSSCMTSQGPVVTTPRVHALSKPSGKMSGKRVARLPPPNRACQTMCWHNRIHVSHRRNQSAIHLDHIHKLTLPHPPSYHTLHPT